jgi:peptidoglycan/LPS O-acetylase OafA/YrhL
LDGLRGIAIILVVLYHNFSFFEYFNHGWIGVDLFFVLSGFLITNILLNSLHTEHYFRNFYTRRVLRIFPLYYLSLLLFLVLLPMIPAFPLDMSYYQEHQGWFWTFLQNWTLLFNNSNSVALNHYWSLAIEEQYYLVWPLVLLLLKKPKRILILCIILIAALIGIRLFLLYNIGGLNIAFDRIFLFTRFDGILFGSMLAVLYHINSKLIRKYFTVFIVLLTIANYLFYWFLKNQGDPRFPVWGVAGYTTFSALFALLVYEAVMGDNRFIKYILTLRVLRFLGKYSYGFYIFHWPVSLLTNDYFKKILNGIFEAGSYAQEIIASLLSTLIGLAIAVLSYHLFEKHFLKLKNRFAA